MRQLRVDYCLVDRLRRRADRSSTPAACTTSRPQVGQHSPRPSCFRSFGQPLSLGLTDRGTVAAYVIVNSTRLSSRNYSTLRDVTLRRVAPTRLLRAFAPRGITARGLGRRDLGSGDRIGYPMTGPDIYPARLLVLTRLLIVTQRARRGGASVDDARRETSRSFPSHADEPLEGRSVPDPNPVARPCYPAPTLKIP
jgi:hypothetical protein